MNPHRRTGTVDERRPQNNDFDAELGPELESSPFTFKLACGVRVTVAAEWGILGQQRWQVDTMDCNGAQVNDPAHARSRGRSNHVSGPVNVDPARFLKRVTAPGAMKHDVASVHGVTQRLRMGDVPTEPAGQGLSFSRRRESTADDVGANAQCSESSHQAGADEPGATGDQSRHRSVKHKRAPIDNSAQ
jgi:hypothetical protein